MTGYSKLFWGFLILLLDFRINGFDIIPDLFGYLFISNGLGMLDTYNPHFEQAKKFALPLTVLSIFELYQINIPMGQISMQPMAILFLLLGILIAIIDLYMIYHICLGTAELATSIGNVEVERNALIRWKYYLYAKIAYIVWTLFVIIIPKFMLLLAVPLIIITLVMAFLIMMLMGQADRVFSNYIPK